MVLYIFLFVILLTGPILVAWFKGDLIIDMLAARNRQRQKNKRQKATRALPVREDVVNALLKAEAKRDQIDDHVGEALANFRQVMEEGRDLIAHQAATAALDDVEQVVLSRESHFANYLDIACLQSETLDIMIEEIELLRDMAEIDRQSKASSPAAERLMGSIEEALQKRKAVDQKLNRLGSGQLEKRPDSGFDAIVG